MATVSYTATQAGYEEALFLPVWTTGTLQAGTGADLRTGGVQFTVSAPNELLFRSLTLTCTSGAANAGTLTISLVNGLDEPPFSSDIANYPNDIPTQQPLIQLYSEAITYAGAAESFTLSLDRVAGATMGQDFQTPLQVLHHGGFQGVISLVLSFTGANTTLASPVLVADQEPFLTGLRTGKQMQSKATFCPRCGTPTFREYLVKDGFTKTLVCSECWDPPEHRARRWVRQKEINP